MKILRDQLQGASHDVDVSTMRSVRVLRRFMPVTDDYRGPRLSVREGGRRMLTPLAVVVTAVFATDVVFAVDSVPAVYGITGDPYLVFATNAFALLGLRALYFVLQGALSKLVHLGYGLATILAFIGVKLVLHWAHGVWAGRPGDPDARLARRHHRRPRRRHGHQPVRTRDGGDAAPGPPTSPCPAPIGTTTTPRPGSRPGMPRPPTPRSRTGTGSGSGDSRWAAVASRSPGDFTHPTSALSGPFTLRRQGGGVRPQIGGRGPTGEMP